MCLGSPATPAPPAPPPPPIAPPTKLSPQVQAARAGRKSKAAALGIRKDSIVTSKQGLTEQNTNAPKSLLGA